MKISKKAYAKINLCLNVFQKNEQGFHNLDSLVTTVDLYDKITVSSRKDNKITLTVTGSNKDYVYNHVIEEDNAYRAVKAYMQETGCLGADILMQKNIPLASGMGGSSTCASTALLCMEELYKMNADLEKLANSLGSDTNYLLKGGWARLTGRGEFVEYLQINKKLQFVAVFSEGGVNTKECFSLFDTLPPESVVYGNIDALIQSLYGEKIAFSECKNALLQSACQINPNVKNAVNALLALSPEVVFMTGSGATVCAIFSYEGLNKWAVEKLKAQGFDAEILTTLIPKS